MSSSTRKKAIQLWQTDVPEGNKEILAKTLFSFENPPGTKIISGSQDAIGIVFPGVNKLNYNKEQYWPDSIESVTDTSILEFIEKNLWFITLSPRIGDFDVLSDTNINKQNVKDLAVATEKCWIAILNKNLKEFGTAFRESFEAQIAMFPQMVNSDILLICLMFRIL